MGKCFALSPGISSSEIYMYLLLIIITYYFKCHFNFLRIVTYSCVVYDYEGKRDLSKGFLNPKKDLRVSLHFLEILSNNYSKKR